MIVFFVVGLADILCQLPVFRGILLAPHLLGRLADRLGVHIIDRCRRSGQGGELRSAGVFGPQVAPVAEPVGKDMPVGLRAEVIHIALHRLVMPFDQPEITVVLVDQPRRQHERTAPLGRIAESVEESDIFGADIGNKPLGSLRELHVGQHLVVEGIHVELRLQRPEHQVQLLDPRQLLAVGAVGEIAHHIALDTPRDKLLGLVEQVVRTVERPGHPGGVARMQAAEGNDLGKPLGILLSGRDGIAHQHVTLSEIGELGAPRLHLVAAQGVGQPVFTAVAAAFGNRVALEIEQLGGVELHALPAFAADFQLHRPREVLAHVVEPFAVAGLADRDHGELFHHPHGFGDGGNQLPALGRHQRLGPGRSVVAGQHPSCPLACRIVILAAEDAAVRHGAFGHTPGAVADNSLVRPVGILDLGLEDHLGITEADERLEIAFARHIVEAVAEHHTEHVASRLQFFADVERLVAHLPVVVAPRRVEEIVAHLRPVQKQLELSQAADIDRRPLDGLGNLHFTAELRQPVERRFPVADLYFVELLSGHHAQAVGQLLEGDPPGSVPIAAVEQADRERADFAPRRIIPRSIAHPHAPVIALPRLQRPPGIAHMQ